MLACIVICGPHEAHLRVLMVRLRLVRIILCSIILQLSHQLVQTTVGIVSPSAALVLY